MRCPAARVGGNVRHGKSAQKDIVQQGRAVADSGQDWFGGLANLNSGEIISRNDRILVTGSNGFIGAKVVEILLEYGYRNIRCFVRPSSRLDRLEKVLSQFDAGKDVALVT